MTAPVVLITGALTGIGRATALAFAREGARVVISGRSDEEGRKLTAELQKLGAEAEFLRSDVRHDDESARVQIVNEVQHLPIRRRIRRSKCPVIRREK